MKAASGVLGAVALLLVLVAVGDAIFAERVPMSWPVYGGLALVCGAISAVLSRKAVG
ncbi:hypothetical protein [Botrimarina sp.]|uniref:hypothetical protein n=1 Tax=Botrimarina sp. TaxID=2795802 RepID=UPI0032EBB938